MEDYEARFIDAETFMGGEGKDKLTFQFIVLSHLRKIGTHASQEHRGGYWNRKPHKNPNINITIDEYIPDTREVFSNSVMYLYNLCYPHFDKEMKDNGAKYEKEIEQAYKSSSVSVEPTATSETPEEAEAKKEGTTRITEFRIFKGERQKLSYRDVKLSICWKIFRELCCFLKREDYFKGKSYEEEI